MLATLPARHRTAHYPALPDTWDAAPRPGPALPAVAGPDRPPQLIGEQAVDYSSARVTERTMRCTGRLRGADHLERPGMIVILESVGGQVRLAPAETQTGRASDSRTPAIAVAPAGMRVSRLSDQVSLYREVEISYLPEALEQQANGSVDLDTIFAPRFMFSDPDVLRLAELLVAECRRNEPPDQLYGDTLALALLLRLARRSEDVVVHRGGLTARQLNRVMDCLRASLAGGVDLATLSELAKLSQSYFIRAFKASTGATPHQWLRQARVERARELLAADDLSLAQIALETGFADQSHLTRVFHQMTGESPGAWRRTRTGGGLQCLSLWPASGFVQ